LTCIDLLPLVNAAHFQYRSNPENFDEHEDFQSVIAHSIIIYHSNKKIGNLDIEGYFLNALEKWPLPNYLNTLIVTNENATEIWIDSAEPAQLLKSFTEELDGAPFSDAGKTRTFAWNALGIYWNLRCENAAEKISVIESLVSCLQIVIADLSEKDMILLPTTVNIEADCGLGLKMDFQEITGGKESNWRVQIPMSDSIEDFSTSLLTFATIMLTRCSLLPEDKCEKIIEEAFKKGLPSKTFIVRPYHELLQEFTHDNKEKDKNGIPRPEAEGFLFSHESKSLEWKSGPGPEYTKKKSQEHIANRYAKSIAPVRYSIPILNKSTEFQDFVASLRAQGYRDWHILLLIANVAFNKRHPSYIKSLPKSQDERSAIMSAFSREETTDDTPITMEDLKSIPIDMQLHIQLSAFCSTWQLDFKRQSPDFDALKRLLTERYGYMEDDIPHAPIFENRNSPEP
jgi:hypothetical protein